MDIVYGIKCPKCSGVIEYDNIYDSFRDEYYLIDYCIGHCVKCEANFRWEEKFKINFDGVNNFEEVS